MGGTSTKTTDKKRPKMQANDKELKIQVTIQDELTQQRMMQIATSAHAKDYINKIKRLISERNKLRKANLILSTIATVFLLTGTGISTVASGLQAFQLSFLSQIFLYTSTVFFAINLALLGIAKYCFSQADQRSAKLEEFRRAIGFKIGDSYGPRSSQQPIAAISNNNWPMFGQKPIINK